MTARIFAYIAHRNGMADDSGAELLAAAQRIDAAAKPTAIVVGSGKDVDVVCAGLCASYSEVFKVASDTLAYPNAELIRKALVKVIPQGSIIKLNAAFVSDVMGIDGVDGSFLKVVRQEFGGQVSTHVRCDISSGAVVNLRPGAFKAVEGVPAAGTVVDKSVEVGVLTAGRRYVETITAETGDVDITKEPVLVSIGRGIQEKDNVAIAEELAVVMGAVVSCSRPVVDAKWLPKSRQVGSSGQTVKPKIYLACGMSGSFQHLAGLKGNPFIVAINKNPKAPIFQVADVGIIADILEFLPELTNKVKEAKGAHASR